jgi:Flp pilus assembly protein TadB
MAARRRPSKSGSPLDERQRKLLEEQEALRQRVEQCNRVIEEAPRLKAERARAQRDELLIDRSTRAHHRLNTTTLADTRYDPNSGPASGRARRRPLKDERRQTRIIFFGLLLVLAVLVVWLLSVWHWQWPS